MKIRSGLVSNSSSSSYVVLIPKETTITREEIQDALNASNIDWEKVSQKVGEDMIDAYAFKIIEEAWKGLKEGYCYWDDYSREESFLGSGRLEALAYLARNKGLILEAFDVSSDCGEMKGITEENILSILNREKK